MFAGKKSAQIREILISESAWEEMTCLFAPSLEGSSQERTFSLSIAENLIAKIQSETDIPIVIVHGPKGKIKPGY